MHMPLFSLTISLPLTAHCCSDPLSDPHWIRSVPAKKEPPRTATSSHEAFEMMGWNANGLA